MKEEFYTYTIDSEAGEFFYKKEFEKIGKDWDSVKIKNSFETKRDSYYTDLDIRMVNEKKKLSICVETKVDYKKSKVALDKAKEISNPSYLGKLYNILARHNYKESFKTTREAENFIKNIKI